MTDYDQMCEDFIYNSNLMGFEYLALYSTGYDTFGVIYGKPLELLNYSAFTEALAADSKNVVSGIRNTGGNSPYHEYARGI